MRRNQLSQALNALEEAQFRFRDALVNVTDARALVTAVGATPAEDAVFNGVVDLASRLAAGCDRLGAAVRVKREDLDLLR